MWKLKIAEGGSPWLRTTNNYVGRQTWEFHSNLGSSEELEAVENARENYRKNRFKMKNSSSLLMRLHFATENPIEMGLSQVKLAEHENVTKEAVSVTKRRAISRYSTLQAHDGHWPGGYGGPMFFMPLLIIALSVTGSSNTVLSAEHLRERSGYLYNHQNEDGGWGFHIEGQSTMFGTVLTYVTLRLLGEEADGGVDKAMQEGGKWILDHGSAITIPSWGKFWLSLKPSFRSQSVSQVGERERE